MWWKQRKCSHTLNITALLSHLLVSVLINKRSNYFIDELIWHWSGCRDTQACLGICFSPMTYDLGLTLQTKLIHIWSTVILMSLHITYTASALIRCWFIRVCRLLKLVNKHLLTHSVALSFAPRASVTLFDSLLLAHGAHGTSFPILFLYWPQGHWLQRPVLFSYSNPAPHSTEKSRIRKFS